jgi:hypothetical protein
VIQVPNRPWFGNIEDPEKHETQYPCGYGGWRRQQRNVHARNFVPDDPAMIVNADPASTLATNPDSGHRDEGRDGELQRQAQVQRQPGEEHAHERSHGTGRDRR